MAKLGVEDLAQGKAESLLHIVDVIRELEPRMEMQTLACFLYVARHGGRNRGVTVEEIKEELGIAQSSVSRNILKLSQIDRKGEPGLDILYTEDDPSMRRRKEVFLTSKGERIFHHLLDFTVASASVRRGERAARYKYARQKHQIVYEDRLRMANIKRLEKLKDDFENS